MITTSLWRAMARRALARAKKHSPDLILLDILMPKMSGYDVIKVLKDDPATAHIPVIFLTALSEESEEENGLAMGAVDYITKPIRPKVAVARINIHMELIRQRRKLEELTNLDALTGIYNRRKFDETLAYEWKRCLRSQTSIAVAMADVDYFKPYNDHYGHSAGDKVLHSVARALSEEVKRSSDCCARYGGEEFAVILPETPQAGAAAMLERCRAAVFDLHLPHAHSSVCDRVTVSIGAACTIPTEQSSITALLKQADDQLYRAKDLGRNRVLLSPELN